MAGIRTQARHALTALAIALASESSAAAAQDGVFVAPTVETVRLVDRPAALLRERAPWDDVFAALQEATRVLEDGLAAGGLSAAGAPLVAFEGGDDLMVGFVLHLPLARAPEPEEADAALAAAPRLVFGATPSGYAMRTVHAGAYAEIGDAYEALTAHLDQEGLVVEDVYYEELLALAADAEAPGSRIAILVVPE
ncbi:hypothetical protein [Salinarimonas sp.]|uniref:hypothetical protein n=1 Tax=Salinarimonas sp. TaxID=2766526 RepID=UPI0032D8B7BA